MRDYSLMMMAHMWRIGLIIVMLVLLSPAATGQRRNGEGKDQERRFIMARGEKVVETDGGEVRVVRGPKWDGGDHIHPIHIGFITMEPNTLFIPQYIDANLIIFVKKGEVKIGWIYKDKLVEKQLKKGDINRIPAGSAFYMVNTGNGQRLQIICSIDTTTDYRWDRNPDAPYFQSFYLGGGTYPKSVLSGFDINVLTTAFNQTTEEVEVVTKGRIAGPIISFTGEAADQPHRLSSILNSELKQAQNRLYSNQDDKEDDENKDNKPWTITNLLGLILRCNYYNYEESENKKSGPVQGPESYNIYDRDPDFKNKYGWTISVDENKYQPLKDSDISVYMVYLSAGSMLAPHVNPQGAEYGMVLSGSAEVQVVYPNGTSAMKADVNEGEVFLIPRFFPFCQIASRGGPLVFFGFTTSAKTNHPQFLAGASSMMRTMLGRELAAGMGVSEGLLKRFVYAQNESVIFPTSPAPSEEEKEREKDRRKEEKKRKKGEEEWLTLKRVVHM